jgi:beta-glucosidase
MTQGFGQQENWAKDLLPRMNELRAEQINGSRLHIPYITVADSVNGLWFSGGTVFPGTISMASSWNLPLYEQVTAASRDENQAMGINWVLSPEVDIITDPRNGRNGEMYGEDTYLVGEFSTRYIKTMQEKDANGFVKVATTIKHFVYGSGSGGVNRASMFGGINHILNDLAPPYRKAIREGQPLSLMASYSSIDGVPASINKYLLQDVLRGTLGFKGLIMSDANAIEYLLTESKVARNRSDAAAKSLRAGLEHELKPDGLGLFVELRSMQSDPGIASLVDEAVRSMLQIKFATGMFDRPLPTLETLAATLRSPHHLSANRNITRESIVLLKNDDAFLPLTKARLGDSGKVAVIGPYANIINAGNYAPVIPTDSRYGNSILRSFENALGKENVLFAQGTSTVLPNYGQNAHADDQAAIAVAVSKAKQAGRAIVVLGSGYGNFMPRYFNNERTDTEGYSHADLGFPGAQQQLLDAVLDTGVPTVLVMSSGQTFVLNESTSRCKAILHSWLAGEYTGDSLVEILLGQVNPSGKLTVSIPEHNGAFPVAYDYLPSDDVGGFGTYTKFDWHWPQLTRKPAMPFGYGLSYTNFSISDVSVSASSTGSNRTISVSAKVTNQGNMEGKEVLQVYFRPQYSVIERPVMKLIRFSKVSVAVNNTATVAFDDIALNELEYYANGEWTVERGNYTFWVGNSSRSKDLTPVNIVI